MPVDRDEFQAGIQLVLSSIDKVNDRLDELNGRTRQAEINIGVLQDRSQRATLWSMGAAGGIVGAYEALKYWFKS